MTAACGPELNNLEQTMGEARSHKGRTHLWILRRSKYTGPSSIFLLIEFGKN